MPIGTIKVLEVRKSKKGKDYTYLKIGDQVMTTWDAGLVGHYSQGDQVEYETKKDGDYTTLIALKPSTATPPPNGLSERDELIIRQVAFKGAIEWAVAKFPAEIVEPVDRVRHLTEEFVKIIKGEK